jgi:hypothetical protein
MNRRTVLVLLGFTLGLMSVVKSWFQLSITSSKSTVKQRNSINIAKDFPTFFKDGFSFKFDYQDGGPPPFTGLQTVRISVREIGNLVVTSGKLIACDPLLKPGLKEYFGKTVSPGHYPVILSIAELQPRNDTRIAYAMLRLSKEPVVKWEIATVNGQYPREDEGEIYGYGVDSGTGCFMDWDVAKTLSNLANSDPITDEAARQSGSDQAGKLSSAALDRFEQEFCNKVILEMEQNEQGAAKNWANVLVNDTTGANVIAFSSGWGDGGYSSYWGYDAKGNLANLVTDFMLLQADEN